jgi:hypothetical protein
MSKTIIATTLLATVAAHSRFAELKSQQAFTAYTIKHNKQYPTEEVEF